MGPVRGHMVQTALLCNEVGRVDLDRKYEPDPDGPAGQQCPGWAVDGGIEVRCTNDVHHTRTVSASVACLAAGISHRQFDHWARHGWIVTQASPGTGNHRTLTEYEVAVVRLMAVLVRAGVQPVTASRLSRHLWDGAEARLADGLVVAWAPMQPDLRQEQDLEVEEVEA